MDPNERFYTQLPEVEDLQEKEKAKEKGKFYRINLVLSFLSLAGFVISVIYYVVTTFTSGFRNIDIYLIVLHTMFWTLCLSWGSTLIRLLYFYWDKKVDSYGAIVNVWGGLFVFTAAWPLFNWWPGILYDLEYFLQYWENPHQSLMFFVALVFAGIYLFWQVVDFFFFRSRTDANRDVQNF